MVLPIQFVFVHKLLYFVFILKYLWQENPIFCRVVNVLRHWVDHHYYDFERDQTLLHKLNIFLKNVKGKAMKKMAESILKVIRRRVRDIRIMAIDIHTSSCICVHLSYNYMYIQVKIWILLNMKDKCSTLYILSLNQKWYVDSSLCLYFILYFFFQIYLWCICSLRAWVQKEILFMPNQPHPLNGTLPRIRSSLIS